MQHPAQSWPNEGSSSRETQRTASHISPPFIKELKVAFQIHWIFPCRVLDGDGTTAFQIKLVTDAEMKRAKTLKEGISWVVLRTLLGLFLLDFPGLLLSG